MVRNTLRRGFTMIELLVVVVIIGILASVLTPVVFRLIDRAADEDARNDLRLLAQASINYYNDTHRSNGWGGFPSAGSVFTSFVRPTSDGYETLDGRARGWVYFEHSGCPREAGDEAASADIGDGNSGSYGLGLKDNAEDDTCPNKTRVNELGCCMCFDAESNEGGISAKPANWQDSASDVYSPAQVAIRNGCLFAYVGEDMGIYTNNTFAKLAAERLGVSRSDVRRAYAMNVITGADEDLYETDHGYGCGGQIEGKAAIRAGNASLIPYEDSSNLGQEADRSKLALFVELDVDNSAMSSNNDLAGDQVWDWDEGDESMGFIHERDGLMYAFVAFADGHVEEIPDPSGDMDHVDKAARVALSKFYGSAGQHSSGKK